MLKFQKDGYRSLYGICVTFYFIWFRLQMRNIESLPYGQLC